MTREEELSRDEELSRAVKDAISRSEPIRATAMDGLKVEASDGSVVLRGVIASEPQRYVAEQLASKVSGVKAVVNQLATSEQLESKIALALASDETTRHLRVTVRVVSGVARLYGAVASLKENELATAVARRAAGGIDTQSHLHVVPPGQPVTLLWQCSMEGRQQAASAKPTPSESEPHDDDSRTASPEAPPAAMLGGTA
jgi:osmotically-inducible protein OsmY